jgi:hypothetical protein
LLSSSNQQQSTAINSNQWHSSSVQAAINSNQQQSVAFKQQSTAISGIQAAAQQRQHRFISTRSGLCQRNIS